MLIPAPPDSSLLSTLNILVQILQFSVIPLLINMTGFPTLQPAFTVRVDIDAPLAVGAQAGSPLVVVPMLSGTVKSEPGFEPALDAEL